MKPEAINAECARRIGIADRWLAIAGDVYIARRRGFYSCEEGFIYQKGEFLTREQAWEIASAAGQIRHPEIGTPGSLFSENLY